MRKNKRPSKTSPNCEEIQAKFHSKKIQSNVLEMQKLISEMGLGSAKVSQQHQWFGASTKHQKRPLQMLKWTQFGTQINNRGESSRFAIDQACWTGFSSLHTVTAQLKRALGGFGLLLCLTGTQLWTLSPSALLLSRQAGGSATLLLPH